MQLAELASLVLPYSDSSGHGGHHRLPIASTSQKASLGLLPASAVTSEQKDGSSN